MSFVYEPAEDSELLLEAAVGEVKESDDVLEVGGGSGYVSERIKNMCRFLLATDISFAAAKVMAEKGIDVVVTDIARGIRKKFSLVLFNPPYLELEEELRRGDMLDVAIDGGKGGMEVILKFIDSLKEVMEDGGRAIVIVSSLTDERVFEEIESRGYSYEIVAVKKLFFERLYAVRIFKRESDELDEDELHLVSA